MQSVDTKLLLEQDFVLVCIVVYCMDHDNIILVHSTYYEYIHVDAQLGVVNESVTFKGMHDSFHWLESQAFLVQVNWLLRIFDRTVRGVTQGLVGWVS